MAKRKKKLKNKRIKAKIDIDQTLLRSRQVFLFEDINSHSAKEIVKQLIVLDKIKVAPIAMYINSPGGCLSDGFAIIDVIQGIHSPIITFITGEACSMAGLISIAGQRRIMSKTAIWMAHDIRTWQAGRATEIIDRTEFLKEEQKKVFGFLSKYTKLSKAEIDKAIRGELWLNAEDCLKKGIIDKIA